MSLNYNDYDSGSAFDLIPKGTLVKCVLEVKPGGANLPGVDDTGVLTQSKNGPAIMLVAEAHIMYGPYVNRRIFCNWTVGSENGNPPPEPNLQTATEISGRTLRGIVESARGIDPNDFSEAGKQARVLKTYNEFNGMEFAVEIGIHKDKSGYYDDKNELKKAIRLGHKDYQALMSGQYQPPAGKPGQGGGGTPWGQSGGPGAAAKPAWQAQGQGPPAGQGQAPPWNGGNQQGTPQWGNGQQGPPATAGPPAGNQQQQGPVPAWTQPQNQPATQPPSQGAGWDNSGQAQPNQQQNMFSGQQPAGGQPPAQQPQPEPAATDSTTKPAWAQ